MRTYDIINAGPNNRFMANGRIVSNSGWAYNPQNLPRILPGSPKLSDALRNCMKAPTGRPPIGSSVNFVADLTK